MFNTRPGSKALPLLLSAFLVAGCASRETGPLPAKTRQQLGKVYLNSTGSTGETFFHADFANGGTGGAIKGAGNGALNGLDSCLNSAMSAGGLAPVVLLVCTPILVPTGIVKGSAAGRKPAIPVDDLANAEQQTNEILHNADLSPALVATIDELSQQHSELAAYEISHGTLPLPEKNESVREIAAKWDYQTVMEITVTRSGFESDEGRVPMMHFVMSAHMKLVATGSGSVLAQQDFNYTGKPHPFKFWFNDEFHSLALEVAQANKTLAGNIIDNVFTK